jgi:hypothetical protein
MTAAGDCIVLLSSAAPSGCSSLWIACWQQQKIRGSSASLSFGTKYRLNGRIEQCGDGEGQG